MKIGHRHYNNLIKEVIWFIQENVFEIIKVGMMIITIIAIVCAWVWFANGS